MRTRSAYAALSISLFATSAMHAQILGELRGRVIDASGASISGAEVKLTQTATGVAQNFTSTGAGEFDFTQLNSGSYSLHVTRSGFASLDRSSITVTTGQTVSVELPLSTGEVGQIVNVSADARLLQTATSDIATTIVGSTTRALPLNSRNFIQLAQLAPGVELPPGTLLPRINGGRPRTNEYLYDGISALQPEPGQVAFFPIIDDIAEFTIAANNVPAEFGRFNGGVVNVSTRGGSNQFHGSLYEFFRNEDLNARNYFASSTARKPKYRRNLYGGTFGGPVLHDKLFFFGDYQGIKQRIGVTRISTVPTLNERAGIFTGIAKIYNPNTGTTNRTEFNNDVINVPFDTAAQNLLPRIPLPTSAALANNYTRTANDDDHQNQFDFRVDGARGTRDRIFARYSYYNEVEQPATPFPEGSGAITGSVIGANNVAGLTHILGQQIVLNEAHTFSPSVVNNFRIGYTRRGNTQAGVTVNGSPSSALGIPGIPTNAAFNNALPLLTFTGFQQVGSSASTSQRYQTSVGELVEEVIFTRGAHSLKVGADLRRYELNAISPPNPTGSFAFTTTGTDTTGTLANGTRGAVGGNAFASFLLGQVDTFQIDLQQRTIQPRDYIHEFFLQDDWRATPRLTLNIGARWSLHMPSTETHNQGAVFNLATQQLDFLGVNGNSRSARELHYGNVAPRVGFTYAVDNKTVVRSGFGIVFIDQSGITTPFTTPQYPFIQNVQQKTQDSYSPAFKLSSGPTVVPVGLTANAGLGQSVYTANRQAGSGYVEQYNVAVQRSITNNLSFDVAYVGSHVVHVGIPDQNLNQLTAAQLAQGTALTAKVTNPYYNQLPASSTLNTPTIAAAQLLKPYPRFQNVATYRNNTSTTNYNAIEAKVQQRMSHGLAVLFAYTHSKLIDDASSVFSSTVLSSPNTSSLVAADTYRPYLERDSSSGDMPNVLTASATWEIAKFAGHGLATAALGGWTLDGIYTMQSGMPVPVTQATNNNSFAGIALQRPNIIGNVKLPSKQRSTAHFFNQLAFTTAPQFTFGNASRNPVRGPAFRDLDLALVKHTRFGEHFGAEFRAEVFDVTNTPAFAQPNGSFTTPVAQTNGTINYGTFGTITATVTDPRVVQFAIKLTR